MNILFGRRLVSLLNPRSERAISLLETAIILIPMIILIMGVVGIIDFIRVGHILSRTEDASIRSLTGRPYRFDGGAIVFNRDAVDQNIKNIVTEAHSALVSQICGSELSVCPTGIRVQAFLQEIQINPQTGAVIRVKSLESPQQWSTGPAVDTFNPDKILADYRRGTKLLATPSGLLNNAFLPTTILVGINAVFRYNADSITQSAFNLMGAGVAKHEAYQITMLRGDVG